MRGTKNVPVGDFHLNTYSANKKAFKVYIKDTNPWTQDETEKNLLDVQEVLWTFYVCSV